MGTASICHCFLYLLNFIVLTSRRSGYQWNVMCFGLRNKYTEIIFFYFDNTLRWLANKAMILMPFSENVFVPLWMLWQKHRIYKGVSFYVVCLQNRVYYHFHIIATVLLSDTMTLDPIAMVSWCCWYDTMMLTVMPLQPNIADTFRMLLHEYQVNPGNGSKVMVNFIKGFWHLTVFQFSDRNRNKSIHEACWYLLTL